MRAEDGMLPPPLSLNEIRKLIDPVDVPRLDDPQCVTQLWMRTCWNPILESVPKNSSSDKTHLKSIAAFEKADDAAHAILRFQSIV
jgi:hypothetical protein